MFKNILCPIDMQPRSKMALRKAIHIAHQFNSNITLLNIHEEFLNKKEMVMSRLSISVLSDEFRKIAIDAKKDMKNLIQNFEADDINCDYILREGKPSEIIIRISDEINSDLIVMGTNGKDSFTDLILGSTAQKVINKASCPVLVIPKGK